ncbi:hypothetical protein [Acinetobacter baumannii]|uniref:hypothetical protein n=1 Tax=Acinetobacter baumannii TaxID=470 RepID=UPI00244337EE|nr:hypothetical protein [Acinetobacter baumannii]MDH7582842.1 hypothetical protein [Acinetobacter baumannii]WGF68184.1 hypothetical protein QCC48_10515 [Acinetobacter baumannii]
MKPEQFIREFGVGVTKSVLIGLPKRCTHMTDDARMFISEHNKDFDDNIRKQLSNLIRLDDLKRLVESLDRIAQLGGLSKAKDHLAYLISFDSEFAGVNKDEIKELQQDMAVHESIYGGGDE